MISFHWPVKFRADWWEPHYEWWEPGQPWWVGLPAEASFLEKVCHRLALGAVHRRNILRVAREQWAEWRRIKPTRFLIREIASAELLLERMTAAGWTPTGDDETEDGFQTFTKAPQAAEAEPDPFRDHPHLRPEIPAPEPEHGPAAKELLATITMNGLVH